MFSIYTKAYSQYEGRLIFLHNFLIILGKGVDFINEFATEKDLQKLRRLIDKTLLPMQF